MPLPSILLDACRVTPAPDSISGDADWPAIVEAAELHAVTPLLARRVAARPEGIPPEAVAALRARYDANSLRNIALTGELTELLARLASAGVDAMPIKGPALALSAYGDLALREFGDLDIVVRSAEFDRARELLGEWGYEPATPLSAAGERALRFSDHHLPLVHRKSRVMVELHWSLDNRRPGRRLDGEWVWANARMVPLLGRELPALSWSALLVYLCVHGAKHGFTLLCWIRDIAGVLAAAPEGELAAAPDLAAAAAARRRLALGILLAQELLGAPARDDLELAGDSAVAPLAREVLSAIADGAELGRARWMMFQCGTFDTLRDRAGYCWHIAAAPHVADVEAVPLPGWLRWTYYAVRPLRLAAKGAGSLRPRRAGGRAES